MASNRPQPPHVLRVLGLALAYFLIAYLALRLTRGHATTAPLWPANAVALVGFLRLLAGRRERLAVLPPIFLASAAANALNGSPALLALGFSLVNVGEISIAAILLARFGPTRVDSVLKGLWFFALAAPAAALFGVLGSTFFATLAHRPGALLSGLTWGASHLLGATLILPLGMTLSRRELAKLDLKRRWPEAAALVFLVSAASFFCFSQTTRPLLFTISPFLILATFRFRLVGANAALFIVALIAGPLTAHGQGPLALMHGASEPVRVLLLQLFLATNSLTAVPVAAALAERDGLLATARRHERETAAANAELTKIARISEIAEEVTRKGHFSMGLDEADRRWSPGVYDIFGLPRDAGPPSQAETLAFFLPPDRLRFEAALERTRLEKSAFDLQASLRTAKGALCRVRIRGRYIEAAEGDSIVGVVRDVTAEEAAAKALEASERRFRQLAETAGDLIIQSTPAGMITYASPAVREIVGCAPEDLIGRQALDLIEPEDRADVAAAARRALSEVQDSWTNEFRIRRTDGEVRWLEAKPRLVWDADRERVTGVTDVLRDVTERRNLEEALETARADAERAASVKAEFLANMSHEFRTPLTSIIGFSDLLRPHLEGRGEPARYLDRIANGSRLMLAIVNDVLDFSKLEAGQIQLRPRAAEPRFVAEGIVQLLKPQADAKGVVLELQCGDEVPAHAEFDDERVRQILLNIVGNAVKFTDRGEVSVRLAYAAGSLRFDVSDTGPGIPAAKQELLFQRFSQVDGSMTRSFGGTGLGLAICRGFIEAMGGEIGVDSREGAGSRFWFTLPAPEVSGSSEDGAPAAEEAGLGGLLGLRVLVADDNPNNREIIRALLGAAEVEVVLADSGEAAIEAADVSPFDVILMDVRMPGIGGAEAARRIRGKSGPNDITPIIAFTAGAEDLGGGRQDHVFDGVLRKPINRAELLGTLLAFSGVPEGLESRAALEA